MSSELPPGKPVRARLTTALAWTIFLAAVAYLGHQAWPELPALVRTARRLGEWQVAGAFVACVATLLFQATYHAVVLERFSGSIGMKRKVVAAYLQAQVIRYLPGKIWGVVYQSQRLAPSHTPVGVVLANVWQSLLTILLSAVVVFTTLAALLLSPAWLLILVPALVSVEWLHRSTAAETALLRTLSRWLPRVHLPANFEPLPVRWVGTSLLLAEWLSFLVMFAILLKGVASVMDALVVGTWYGGASMLALAAVVVPAGLAVREAIFLAAPDAFGIDMAVLLTAALLARFLQIAAELALALGSTALGSRLLDE